MQLHRGRSLHTIPPNLHYIHNECAHQIADIKNLIPFRLFGCVDHSTTSVAMKHQAIEQSKMTSSSFQRPASQRPLLRQLSSIPPHLLNVSPTGMIYVRNHMQAQPNNWSQ